MPLKEGSILTSTFKDNDVTSVVMWSDYPKRKKSETFLRAAPRKYQLDLETAENSKFSKLAQNEALRALVTKILF